MRVFNKGIEIIQKYDPLFLLDVDTIQALAKEGFSVPLVFGEQNVKPIQGDITFYLRPFKDNNWSLAILVNASSLDFQIKEGGTMPESFYGWKKRFIILGIRFTITDFIKITSGYLYKISPLIIKDEFGNKYFSQELDENRDLKHSISNSSFVNTDISGIDLGGVLKAGQGIDFLECKIPFYFNDDRLMVKPQISYFAFHNLIKAGMVISNEIPVKIEGTKIDSILLELEGHTRVYAKDDWTGLNVAILNLYIVGEKKKEAGNSIKNLESYANLKISGSFSKGNF